MNQLPQPKPEATAHPAERPTRIGMVRFSAAQFLCALILFFVVAPLVEELPHGDIIDGTLLTLVLASGVLAVGRRRQTLVWAVVLGLPTIICRWVSHSRPDLMSKGVFLTAGLVFVIFMVAHLLLFVLSAPRVNSEVLCAGISGYLMLGLLWAFAYLLASQLVPDSFVFNGAAAPVARSLGNFEAFYFSFATLSTVGYGDIAPLSNGARMLAMTEAMTGTLYVAMFIARLVALYSSQGSRSSEAPAEDARPQRI